MSQLKKEHENHEAWADALRVIAMFGVILIHTSTPVFYEYRKFSMDFFWTANVIGSFSRVSVPLFVMLSGFLLLNRSESTVSFGVARRIMRVLIPLFFWSFTYQLYSLGKQFSVVQTIAGIAQGPIMYHLWFVYMLIGIYLILPILRLISSALIKDSNLALYCFLMWFLINSSAVYFPLPILNHLKLSSFFAWPGYFILGYYLAYSALPKKIPRKILALAYLIASLSTCILTYILNSNSHKPIETAYECLSPNLIIASIAIFLWFRKIKIPHTLAKYFAYASPLMFPVYLMHILVIEILKNGSIGISISSYSVHPAIGIIFLASSTFLISLTLAAISRIIPFSQKMFG